MEERGCGMKRELNMQPMVELLTREIEPEVLASTLEEVLWRYVGMLLIGADDCVPGRADADQVYELRLLKEALEGVTKGG